MQKNMMSNQNTDPTTKHGILSGMNMKLKKRSQWPSHPLPHSMMLLLIGCMEILFLIILAALLMNNQHPTFSAPRANQSILFCLFGCVVWVKKFVHLK